MYKRNNIHNFTLQHKNFFLGSTINLYAILVLAICITGIPASYLSAQPLAKNLSKYLGNVISDGNNIRTDFTKYWNQVTPENAGKWASVEGSQDSYNWGPLDKIYNFAMTNGFTYKHHALVWGNQYPAWITSLDTAAQRAQVQEWIQLVGGKYPNMNFVDVVNEPFNAPPPFMEALGGTGKTGWDWVVTAFRWARQYCSPNVKLVLNEYNVLQSNTVTDNFIRLADTLKVRGLIDAVAIQGHYFEFKGTNYTYDVNTIKSNLDKLATLGLPIYISEFDINEADDNTQLQSYKTYFPLFWEHPAVKGITLWGYVQYQIWKTNAYLVTDRKAERPALKWLRTYLLSPYRPILISPLSTTDEKITPLLKWHSSNTATKYNLQVSLNNAFTSVVVDTSTADTVFTIKGLNERTRYFWRVSASNAQGTGEYSATANFVTETVTDVAQPENIPSEFKLEQNYPNPFNPSTNISFSIPAQVYVSLKVYNLLGEEVATLFDGVKQAGNYTVMFIADQLPSGIYFCRMKADNFVNTKKIILLK